MFNMEHWIDERCAERNKEDSNSLLVTHRSIIDLTTAIKPLIIRSYVKSNVREISLAILIDLY